MVACLAILADKDAAAMVAALAPALDRAVCTELPPERACGHSGSRLATRRGGAGGGLRGGRACRPRPSPTSPRRCGRAARRWPPRPPPAVLLVTGSHYVLDLRARRLWRSAVCATIVRRSAWIAEAGSELLSMMALVAAVVATVILVFFGVGYLFGSLFL